MFDIIIKKHGTDEVLEAIEDANAVVAGFTVKGEKGGNFMHAEANAFDFAIALYEAAQAIETVSDDEPDVEKALRFIAAKQQAEKAEREG